MTWKVHEHSRTFKLVHSHLFIERDKTDNIDRDKTDDTYTSKYMTKFD